MKVKKSLFIVLATVIVLIISSPIAGNAASWSTPEGYVVLQTKSHTLTNSKHLPKNPFNPGQYHATDLSIALTAASNSFLEISFVLDAGIWGSDYAVARILIDGTHIAHNFSIEDQYSTSEYKINQITGFYVYGITPGTHTITVYCWISNDIEVYHRLLVVKEYGPTPSGLGEFANSSLVIVFLIGLLVIQILKKPKRQNM